MPVIEHFEKLGKVAEVKIYTFVLLSYSSQLIGMNFTAKDRQ